MSSDQANAYFADIAFASQLCGEFAADESSNLELSAPLSEAHAALQLILAHNAPDAPPPSNRAPAWPMHDALIRFDLPLQRLTTHFIVTKIWKPRFHVLRSGHLYYSDGKQGQADTREGALAFVRSKPAPDGHYCVNLSGACVLPFVQRRRVMRVCRLHCSMLQSARGWAAVRVRNQISIPSTTSRSRACGCPHVSLHLPASKRVPCCCR